MKPGSGDLMPSQASVRPPSDVTDTEYFSPDQSTASAVYSLLDLFKDFEITVRTEQDGGDETESYRVRDGWIEPSNTAEEFRRVKLETPDGETMEYLTTLSIGEYDPIDLIQIYTLRTLIEILFRELKQYLNVENFHSTTLNGVLIELFCH